MTIVVAGRPVAELGPRHSNRWRRGAEIAAIFQGGQDGEFARDRDALPDTVTDPFEAH